ncbi:MAG: hypothetical protein NZ735_00835 [Candidatus Marinimicrobia bacterium]|nr:hypothetical protein [Candidatus Neomarinimicrobiota bacterium]
MNKLTYIMSRVPVFLFLAIVVFNLIACNIEVGNYLKVYYVANETLGAPLVSNLFMLAACYRYKLCWYNKVSVYGLLLLNLINILAITTPLGDDSYYHLMLQFAMIPVSILAVILLIKKI